MIRISGVTLPDKKKIAISLSYLYGIGLSLAEKILKQLNIDGNIRTKDLTEEQVNRLRAIIEKDYKVEGALRRDVFGNIKRMKEIRCYRGTRHAKGLPCRGQRTKTNNRTVRGNVRKTMGSGRKPAAQKT
ncbi:30S ribosomal protein S13 [Candidatus Falkowbacteria bacterium]|nr:30S ribosomal protein S13 [Candidatus Falkowbacteria bacterium]